jgi:hypothetical protein
MRRGAPLLGEHSVEILRELGWDAGLIQELLAQKIVDAPHIKAPHIERAAVA